MKNLFSKSIIVFITAITMLCSSCEKKNIEGLVQDNFAHPLADVNISIGTSQFIAKSSAEGKYSIGYLPGIFTVTYSKPGYVDSVVTLTIAEQQKYRMNLVRLYKIPEGDGIFHVGKNGYEPLQKGTLDMTTEEHEFSWEGPLYDYYYRARGEYPSLVAYGGNNYPDDFVIKLPQRMRMYRVAEANNCFLQRTDYWAKNSAIKAVRLNAEVIEKRELTIITAAITKGKYVFAGMGQGVGKFSTAATEPIYFFEIK